MSEELRTTFQSSVEAGKERLQRRWPELLATGAVGGIDVGIGVFGLFVVQHATGNAMAGSLAFSIGFIALLLAKSELFTENFVIPVTAVAAGRASPLNVLRLWAGTAAMNLAGGWVIMAVVIISSPVLKGTAIEIARHPLEMGIGSTSFASAVLGGTVITLMTWMERSTDSMPAKLVAAVGAAFLLASGKLLHVIVISLEAFAALHAGAPFGYADWLGIAGWAALGNAVGGICLVTLLRLAQLGKGVLQEERSRPPEPTGGPTRAQGETPRAFAPAEATPR